MNFKNIFAAATAALVMAGGLASCADDTLGELTGDGTVTFNFSIDDVAATRTLGDVSGTKTAYIYIYDSEGTFIKKESVSLGTSLHGTATLSLTRGMTYDLVFVAQNNSTNNPYTINQQTGMLTINYGNMNGGTQKDFKRDNDFFYTVRNGYKAGSSNSESVLLRRPLAQINFGTDDLDADIVKKEYGDDWYYLYADMHLNYAHSSFNLITGKVADEAHEVTFTTHKSLSTSSQSFLGDFPINGYKYLYTAYVLVDENAPLDDITLNVRKSTSGAPVQTLTVPNAPVKRNYRTNIYGSLLTSTSNWQISIDPLFGVNNDQNLNVWAGDVEDLVFDADGNAAIYNPAQLAGLAKLVNDGDNLKGKTITLKEDLYLAGFNWTPIGSSSQTPFYGTFDGNGHTIYDLAVKVNADKPAGLFGSVREGGVVKNLTVDGAVINALGGKPTDSEGGVGVVIGYIFRAGPTEKVTVKNATLNAYHWTGGVVGKGYGSVNECRAENVTISLSCYDLGKDWDYGDKAGAIIGQHDESSYTLKDNSATGVKITGYRHLGGLFGHINYAYQNNPKTVYGNSVADAIITQDFTHNYKKLANGDCMGEIWGYIGGNVDESANSASNVTLVAPSNVADASSLVAAAQNGGFITLDDDIDMSSLSGTVTIAKPTVLNLNGSTLKIKGSSLRVADVLTVEGEGEIISDGFTLTGDPGSTIVINDGLISTTSTSKYNQAINTSGDLVVTGGVIKGVNAPAVTLNWANERSDYYKVEISGGEIITDNEYSLNIVGSSDPNHVQEAVINGGVFVGNSGVRADGYVNVTINGGYFIQESTSSNGHAYCAGAELSHKGTVTTINGGYFYGNPNQAICNAGNATTVVKAAIVNKALSTNGSSFSLAPGSTFSALDTPKTLTIDGKTYSFGYQVK